MGQCAKLKWNRKKLNMTQKQFAEAAGLDVGTINKLENDETAWLTVRRETEDKIYKMFEGNGSVWDMKPAEVKETITIDKTEEPKKMLISEVTQEMVDDMMAKKEKPVKKVHNGLSEQDKKTLTLIEFAYEGLAEAVTHEEFVANLNMIKRIIKKY